MESEKTIEKNIKLVEEVRDEEALSLRVVISTASDGDFYVSSNGILLECAKQKPSSQKHFALYYMEGKLMATKSQNSLPDAHFLISFPHDLCDKKFYKLKECPSFINSGQFYFTKAHRLSGRQYMRPSCK